VKRRNGFTVAWLAILGAGAATEVIALRSDRKDDTLSEHVWRWFGVKQGRKAKTRRAVLVMLMVWLTAHFVSGGDV